MRINHPELKTARRYKEGFLSFKVVPVDEPLIARGGLLLPCEMAKALKLPEGIDKELSESGSGRGYKPSRVVMSFDLVQID